MDSIPYIEYTKLEKNHRQSDKWYYMSHLSNACAAADAHRTSAYAICLLSEGALQLETDLFKQRAEAPAIFTITPSAIRKFTDLKKSYDAKILFFRKEVFLDGQADIHYLDRFDFFEKTGRQITPLTPKQLQQFQIYFEVIYEKTLDRGPQTTAIVRSLIYAVLHELEDVLFALEKKPMPILDKSLPLLSQFKALLAENFIAERQVAFYAGKLHLTPKYFSTIIKEASGKTPAEWINEMLILEAKVRLQNHENSITQIAYELDFSDASHFGRFFRKHAGMSPTEYRASP